MNRTTNYTLSPLDVSSRSCGCIGPQNGNPKCPCMMQGLRQVDGRWVEVIDHGPVKEEHKFDWGTEKVLKEAIAKMMQK